MLVQFRKKISNLNELEKICTIAPSPKRRKNCISSFTFVYIWHIMIYVTRGIMIKRQAWSSLSIQFRNITLNKKGLRNMQTMRSRSTEMQPSYLSTLLIEKMLLLSKCVVLFTFGIVGICFFPWGNTSWHVCYVLARSSNTSKLQFFQRINMQEVNIFKLHW